jgi:hypothetical protein
MDVRKANSVDSIAQQERHLQKPEHSQPEGNASRENLLEADAGIHAPRRRAVENVRPLLWRRIQSGLVRQEEPFFLPKKQEPV